MLEREEEGKGILHERKRGKEGRGKRKSREERGQGISKKTKEKKDRGREVRRQRR